MPYVRAGRQRPWSLREGLLLADRFILDHPAVESIRSATWRAYDRAAGGQVALKVFDLRYDAGADLANGRGELDGAAWWRPQLPVEDLCAEVPLIAAALEDRGVRFHGSHRHRTLRLFAWDWHSQTSVWTQPVGPSATGIKDLLGIGLHASISLADLHSQGLLHGNIKPTSLMLGGDGKLLLGDHLGGRARQPASLDTRPLSNSDIEMLALDEDYDVHMLVATLIRLGGTEWDPACRVDWMSILRDFRLRLEPSQDRTRRRADALDDVMRVFGDVVDRHKRSPSAADIETILGSALARVPAPELPIAVAPSDRRAMSALVGPGRRPLPTGTFICINRAPVLPEDAVSAFEDRSLYEQPPLEVVDLLGWGGFALVYRCFWHHIGRMVAAKELYPRSARRVADGSLVSDGSQFEQQKVACYTWEGLNCAALTGNEAFVDFYERGSGEVRFPLFPANPPPTIVPTLWALPSHGTIIVITELAPGAPIQRVVSESGPVDYGTALQALRTTVENLSWLADFGVGHRDLRPSNVMLDPVWGDAYLLDFGLARAKQEDDGDQADDLVGLGRLIDFSLGGPDRAAGRRSPRERRLDDLIAACCSTAAAGLSMGDLRGTVAGLVDEFADRPPFAGRRTAHERRALCGGWRRMPPRSQKVTANLSGGLGGDQAARHLTELG